MNWPFFNLVHFEEFFQKKSGHPKFVGDGTEYANRSDNFPRFIYLDSLLEVTLFCTSWWQRGNLKAFFLSFFPSNSSSASELARIQIFIGCSEVSADHVHKSGTLT